MSKGNAVVTGAASGVGKECTRILLDRGWRVAALDLSVAPISEAFGDGGGNLFTIKADIGTAENCARAVAMAVQRLGHVDSFLHFAAVWTGPLFLTQAIARHMVARGRGAIVLTTSDSVNVGGVAGGPAYVASKAASVGLTHSFAKALGPKGVRVNAVSPGVIETPMTANWPKALKEGAAAQTPLGRIAKPDDIATVACFLASDDAKFVNGEIIEVNGGFYFK
jgi:3-oxoacyl-[acyl-carrier protein] reductase